MHSVYSDPAPHASYGAGAPTIDSAGCSSQSSGTQPPFLVNSYACTRIARGLGRRTRPSAPVRANSISFPARRRRVELCANRKQCVDEAYAPDTPSPSYAQCTCTSSAVSCTGRA
ncbi:hypothetical protein AURDEDRAFT_117821 [Auricularia subglabra TFB-10046 SS5]|uniref:Uncharacterized protein n=1 Tax=Auricularia subglabra (strain TFB-10046 / SS5) TaxID=717982 RepID=J0CTV4_AURST|nr:hypothetical protein AURDEDRAFT_117821 [Auricularia subglabra TFB-10046 SS5]